MKPNLSAAKILPHHKLSRDHSKFSGLFLTRNTSTHRCDAWLLLVLSFFFSLFADKSGENYLCLRPASASATLSEDSGRGY